jgi:hypothetical protein
MFGAVPTMETSSFLHPSAVLMNANYPQFTTNMSSLPQNMNPTGDIKQGGCGPCSQPQSMTEGWDLKGEGEGEEESGGKGMGQGMGQGMGHGMGQGKGQGMNNHNFHGNNNFHGTGMMHGGPGKNFNFREGNIHPQWGYARNFNWDNRWGSFPGFGRFRGGPRFVPGYGFGWWSGQANQFFPFGYDTFLNWGWNPQAICSYYMSLQSNGVSVVIPPECQGGLGVGFNVLGGDEDMGGLGGPGHGGPGHGFGGPGRGGPGRGFGRGFGRGWGRGWGYGGPGWGYPGLYVDPLLVGPPVVAAPGLNVGLALGGNGVNKQGKQSLRTFPSPSSLSAFRQQQQHKGRQGGINTNSFSWVSQMMEHPSLKKLSKSSSSKPFSSKSPQKSNTNKKKGGNAQDWNEDSDYVEGEVAMHNGIPWMAREDIFLQETGPQEPSYDSQLWKPVKLGGVVTGTISNTNMSNTTSDDNKKSPVGGHKQKMNVPKKKKTIAPKPKGGNEDSTTGGDNSINTSMSSKQLMESHNAQIYKHKFNQQTWEEDPEPTLLSVLKAIYNKYTNTNAKVVAFKIPRTREEQSKGQKFAAYTQIYNALNQLFSDGDYKINRDGTIILYKTGLAKLKAIVRGIRRAEEENEDAEDINDDEEEEEDNDDE